jgi:hypothetical protein
LCKLFQKEFFPERVDFCFLPTPRQRFDGHRVRVVETVKKNGFWFNETNGALVTGNGVQSTGTGIIDTYSGSANGYAPNVIQSKQGERGIDRVVLVLPGTDVLTGNTFTNVGVTAGTCN